MSSMELDYFESYGDLDIHKLMLQDKIRNKAYKQAIEDNKDAFVGKTVLDVGAGTGILSVYCAQVGASKVYAVEASEIFKLAEEIIRENNFQNVIEVIHGRVENFSLPQDKKVDIIVSEWMGFYLLHEGMLDSVLWARDNLMKPGGLLFPESATIYAAPCSVPNMYEDWDDVEGVTMKRFASKLRNRASHKPETALVKPDQLLADPEVILWIDLGDVTLEQLKCVKTTHIPVATKSGKYQGICIWFTCTFPSSSTEPVILSTGPDEPETHWKQTTIVLPEEYFLSESEALAYEIVLRRMEGNERRYDIELTMLNADEIEHPEYCTCNLTKCILVSAMLQKYEKNEFGQGE